MIMMMLLTRVKLWNSTSNSWPQNSFNIQWYEIYSLGGWVLLQITFQCDTGYSHWLFWSLILLLFNTVGIRAKSKSGHPIDDRLSCPCPTIQKDRKYENQRTEYGSAFPLNFVWNILIQKWNMIISLATCLAYRFLSRFLVKMTLEFERKLKQHIFCKWHFWWSKSTVSNVSKFVFSKDSLNMKNIIWFGNHYLLFLFNHHWTFYNLLVWDIYKCVSVQICWILAKDFYSSDST